MCGVPGYSFTYTCYNTVFSIAFGGLQVLTLVERNETSYNEIVFEESVFQNCVTESISDTAHYHEQVELCKSTTQPDLNYRAVIRVANANYTSYLTNETIPSGAVQVMYNISWPTDIVRWEETRFLMKSDMKFTLPTSLMDMFFLGT